jgi:hypothetical protein
MLSEYLLDTNGLKGHQLEQINRINALIIKVWNNKGRVVKVRAGYYMVRVDNKIFEIENQTDLQNGWVTMQANDNNGDTNSLHGNYFETKREALQALLDNIK